MARRFSSLLVCLFAPGLSSCWRPLPNVAVEAEILAATGVAADLTFAVEGRPLDEPEPELGDGRLGWEQALRTVVTTDPRIQEALARVRAAVAAAHQARALPNPILGLVLRWGPGAPQVEAGLTEAVVGLLRQPRRVRIADFELRAAAAHALTVALDVVLDVQAHYAQAQAADGLVPLLEQRAQALASLLDVAESRLRNGEGTQAEVATLASQRAQLEVEVAAARAQQRESRLRLARRVGVPSSAADWRLDRWRAPDLVAGDERAWIDAALAHRAELRTLDWRLAALDDERAGAGTLPLRDASVGIEAQRSPDWFSGPSLSVPVPVFDDGSPERARLDAEIAGLRHARTLAMRQAVEEVRVAFAAFEAQSDNLRRVREVLIPLQRRRREQAESAYRLGQADTTVLFLAEQDLRAAEAHALQLEREVSTARFRLQRAAGGAHAQPEDR
ncbi:MAG: TolC family protein [Planctomycetota bacterium]